MAKPANQLSSFERFMLSALPTHCETEVTEHTKWNNSTHRGDSCKETYERYRKMVETEKRTGCSFGRDSLDVQVCRTSKVFGNVQTCQTFTGLTMEKVVDLLKSRKL